MDAMNLMGNVTVVGEALEAIGALGEAVFNNSVGYAAGAAIVGMAVAAATNPDDASDQLEESDSDAIDHSDRWSLFEDVSDTKAAPPGEEPPAARGAKRQRTGPTTSLVTQDAPMAAPMRSSYDEYRRPTATIQAATEFARPRVAPNLRPIIEAANVEPAILEESRRLQVPLTVQAITAARARVGTNRAAIAKLQFEINELNAEIREAEELEPVYDWACKQRMLAKSRSVKRVSKMRSLFDRCSK